MTGKLEEVLNMKQEVLARWLKVVLIGAGICGLILYGFFLPGYGAQLAVMNPEFSDRYWPWLIFLWITGIPCYIALVLGWKIASNIKKDRSFSNDNARYLKWISWLAAGDAIYYFIGNMVLLFSNMSHPGVTLYSLLVVFAGVCVTVAAAVLSHLVQKAACLQEQSDLTI